MYTEVDGWSSGYVVGSFVTGMHTTGNIVDGLGKSSMPETVALHRRMKQDAIRWIARRSVHISTQQRRRPR